MAVARQPVRLAWPSACARVKWLPRGAAGWLSSCLLSSQRLWTAGSALLAAGTAGPARQPVSSG